MSALENMERARFALTSRDGQYIVTQPTWRWPFIGRPESNGSAPRDDKPRRDRIGVLLMTIATIWLIALAVTMGIVSWHAQFAFVNEIKHNPFPSALEALGLDAGAVIFSATGMAHARLGRRGAIERVLVCLCAAGSAAMNLGLADLGSPRSVAVYIMPPVLFAISSDRFVAVIRMIALGSRSDDDEKHSAWRYGGVAALYALRFVLAPPSTATGLRRAVLNATPLPSEIVTEPETVHEITSKPRRQVTARSPRPAITDGRSYGGQPTKTSRFLDAVVLRHGSLSEIPLDSTARIAGEVCAETAGLIGMDPGNARTVLRKAVLAASDGTDEETTE